MSIQQIHAGYNPLEDRLLLRVILAEGDELRFWLTRASVRDFLPVMGAWMSGDDPGSAALGATAGSFSEQAARTMKAFQREKAAGEADFSQPLKPGERFPFGETPLLVAKLTLKPGQGSQDLLLQLADNRLITLHLGPDALPGVARLLQSGIAQADWGYAGPAAPQAVAQSAPPSVLH